MSTPDKTIGTAVTLKADLAAAEAQVTEALKAEGFGILTEIDVQGTFKQKLDVDFRPYKILGACNPKLAHQALTVTDEVGMLLPCNVTLSQLDAKTTKVSFVDPIQMLGVMGNPELRPIAEDARDRLARAIQSLS